MEARFIRHRPRHMDFTLCRRLEIERDIMTGPDGQLEPVVCPECGGTMMYRGRGRLRNGSAVQCFECVHSHREVYSLSVIISD